MSLEPSVSWALPRLATFPVRKITPSIMAICVRLARWPSKAVAHGELPDGGDTARLYAMHVERRDQVHLYMHINPLAINTRTSLQVLHPGTPALLLRELLEMGVDPNSPLVLLVLGGTLKEVSQCVNTGPIASARTRSTLQSTTIRPTIHDSSRTRRALHRRQLLRLLGQLQWTPSPQRGSLAPPRPTAPGRGWQVRCPSCARRCSSPRGPPAPDGALYEAQIRRLSGEAAGCALLERQCSIRGSVQSSPHSA
jgi:hypothetical protein